MRVVLSLGAVAAVSLGVYVLEPVAPVLSLGVLYLFAVLPVAALWGLRYAVPVSIVSMLAFNWFFLPPTHTFQLRDSENWVALAVYLGTAVSVSALATRQRRLAREDAAKTAVLRSVSHDLRSPITAILTASEVARGNVSSAQRDELLDAIRLQAQRLDRLVANLLDLSRLEAGAATPDLEVWPVDGLVARALDAIGDGGDAIEVRLPAVPPTVEVDATQIEHVLVNLLENALRFSPAVEVSVAEADGEVVVRVSDDGPGVARGRTGVDLRAVRAWDERQRRAGLRPRSRNRTRLPRGEPRPALGGVGARARLDVRVLPSGRRRPGVSGARVLVVDDEPQILRALQIKLGNAGYLVDAAATAKDALAQAAMRPPDAVILDLLLPDGSGTEVCRELRRWSSAPILVLSAVGDEREKIAALDAGADDYVTKPFSGDELLARLRAALRRTAPSGEPVIEVGELRLDRDKRTVTMAGAPVALTPTE